MMAGKARLFADADSLAAILATDDPSRCKALGRKVRGFDESAWAAARFDLVTLGNVEKFGQARALRAYLLEGQAKTSSSRRNHWRGINLLGFALVRARAILRGDLP